VLITLLILVVVGLGFVLLSGTSAPTARLAQPIELVGRSTPLAVELEAGRAGLRSWEIFARKPDGSETLVAEERFPRSTFLGSGVSRRSAQTTLDAKTLGLPEGTSTLVVYADDYAPLGWLRSRAPRLEIPVAVDLTPPRIEVQGGQHYVYQGGSDLVVYEVSEDAVGSGIAVGSREFPGVHPRGAPPSVRVVLYALPHDADLEAAPRVTAVDAAGNRRFVNFPVEVRRRAYPAEEILVSDSFVRTKIQPILESHEIAVPEDPVDAFLRVNREMRRSSEEQLQELNATSDPDLRITTAFRQQPGTQVGSRFAEHRTYRYNDRVVDEQTHLGYDLASVKQAPVLAAEAGTVRGVLDLGIYGNVVVLDHGLGLASLYAHLSSTSVEPGATVAAGDEIGKSGETGLAAGDHLHFSILVGGHHVDPIEWWDPKWVSLHVLEPLAEARGVPADASAATAPAADPAAAAPPAATSAPAAAP